MRAVALKGIVRPEVTMQIPRETGHRTWQDQRGPPLYQRLGLGWSTVYGVLRNETERVAGHTKATLYPCCGTQTSRLKDVHREGELCWGVGETLSRFQRQS